MSIKKWSVVYIQDKYLFPNISSVKTRPCVVINVNKNEIFVIPLTTSDVKNRHFDKKHKLFTKVSDRKSYLIVDSLFKTNDFRIISTSNKKVNIFDRYRISKLTKNVR